MSVHVACYQVRNADGGAPDQLPERFENEPLLPRRSTSRAIQRERPARVAVSFMEAVMSCIGRSQIVRRPSQAPIRYAVADVKESDTATRNRGLAGVVLALVTASSPTTGR